MNTGFSNEEIGTLRDIIEHQLNEIDVEVGRTDTFEFKEMLKRRRDILKQILNKLVESPVAAS